MRWATWLLCWSVSMASAQDVEVALRMELPPSCEGAGIAEDVARRLGRDPFAGGDPEMRVRLGAEARGEGYSARVVLERGGRVLGVRRFEVDGCAELRDRAALILALVVDTQLPAIVAEERAAVRRRRRARRGRRASSEVSTSDPDSRRDRGAGSTTGGSRSDGATSSAGSSGASTSGGPASPASGGGSTSGADSGAGLGSSSGRAESDTASRSEAGFEERETRPEGIRTVTETQLALVGAGHLGWFPNLTGGGGVALGLRFGDRFALRTSVLAWAPSEETTNGLGARLHGVALRIAGCSGGDLGVARLGACATVEVGALSARGVGFDENDAVWRASLRAGLMVRLGVRAGRLRLGLAVGVDTPVLRDRFVFETATGGTGVAHDPPPVAGILAVSAGLALGE